MDFDFGALSRHPDVEAPEFVAADAADRLLLDEAADALAAAAPGTVVVIGDGYGALTLAAAVQGVRGIRVHQDALSGERALAANAERLGIPQTWEWHDLDEQLLKGAELVLVRLPRSLDALSEIAEAIARHAAPTARVFAAGMVKHMAVTMNEVLRASFGRLDVTHARQKARVLIAAEPLAVPDAPTWPRTRLDAETGLAIVARGAAFAGPAVDIGTRFLLSQLDAAPRVDEAIDLGCGTGVIAAWLARSRPHLRVTATDQSAAAVASARATAAANGLADRIVVVRDDALASRPDASAELIVLNPPFHIGHIVHRGIALKLFADVGRVLAPGGQLWTVWNSHLRYRPELERLVGPTRQLARDRTFTVTASTAR